jgi:hypothetical protein
MPLRSCLHVDRMRRWEIYFATMAEEFTDEIAAVRQHLRQEEVPPLARIPRWIMEAFVQWPSVPPS